MNTVPVEDSRQFENCLPTKAVQFNVKFVEDKTLQSINQQRRYQRRGSKTASMIMAAASTVHQNYDETNEERTNIFMNTSPNDRETTLDKNHKRQRVEFISETSFLEKQAHLERIMESFILDHNKAVVAKTLPLFCLLSGQDDVAAPMMPEPIRDDKNL